MTNLKLSVPNNDLMVGLVGERDGLLRQVEAEGVEVNGVSILDLLGDGFILGILDLLELLFGVNGIHQIGVIHFHM